jgi:hypothetical protein
MNIADLNPYTNQLVKLTAKSKADEGLILIGYISELHICIKGDYIIWNDADEDCKQKFVIRNVIDVEKIV